MVAVLEGAIEIVFSVGGQLVPFLTQRQGMVSRDCCRSHACGRSARSGRAVGLTRLYRIHQSLFDEMLHVAPSLGPVLVSMMTDRVRETTRLTQQREKMMALGKLSAGLAHELNNPATAVRRDADALDEQLARLPELTRMLLVHGIDAQALAARRSVARGVEQGRRARLLRRRRARWSGAVSSRRLAPGWTSAASARAGCWSSRLSPPGCGPTICAS